MKRIITIFITIGLITSCSAQKNISKNEIISEIISSQKSNLGETRIVRELNSELAEGFLQRINSTENLKFENSDNEIHLTSEEMTFFSESIKKQYGFKWTEDEIKGFAFINTEEEITEFLIKDKDNRVLMLSKPILFRNNKYAFEYIAHFGFGQRPEYVGYRIYINQDDKWENFINLN